MYKNKFIMRNFFILLIVAFFSLNSTCQIRARFSDDGNIDKLLKAEKALKYLYVDTVNENKLVEDAIQGMLEKLDPHSSYTTAKETKAMNEPLQGNFEGIGVQFNMIEDRKSVV